MSEPKLLRIPQSFRSVDDVLETAKKLDLPHVLVLAEHENGDLTILHNELSLAEANWLLDRTKITLLGHSAVHTDEIDRG